ncbi:MAG TPA: HD domain-containing protein [Chloroflexi bacterium]|nr:HD domain-containing protein [Chloroflexota bacterium]
MNASAALELFLDAHRLKCTPRTGWVMRGVVDAESVADHSFGVAFIALVLGEMVDQPLDRAKLLTIALLHDLQESSIGDIPMPVTRHLPPSAKYEAEQSALKELLDQLPWSEDWLSWWQEFEQNTSIEGQIVRDADQLDMLIQAHIYEQTTGNRYLAEFWPPLQEASFNFPAAQAIYEQLVTQREHPAVRSAV